MPNDYRGALPTITTRLRQLRLANVGAITPLQLDQLYHTLGWESGDLDEERRGKKNLLNWIRQNVPGMDVEKGAKVGWDRKVSESMSFREKRLEMEGDGEDGSNVTDCGDGEDGGDVQDCGQVDQGSRQEDQFDYFTPGWKPSSATVPHLRNILTTYGVPFPTSANKATLVQLVTVAILPMVSKILASKMEVTPSSTRGLRPKEVCSPSREENREEKKQKKGKQEEKEKSNLEYHNLVGLSDMTFPVKTEVEEMEDMQRDMFTPQDKVQAELNRTIHERDGLLEASWRSEAMIEKLKSQVAQLQKDQFEMEDQHSLAMAKLRIEEQHLRTGMQDRLDQLRAEHIRLRSTTHTQAAEVSALRTQRDRATDSIRQLRAEATVQVPAEPKPKELQEDASMAPLYDLLGAVYEHARAGQSWKCLEVLGNAIGLVAQMGQRESVRPTVQQRKRSNSSSTEETTAVELSAWQDNLFYC